MPLVNATHSMEIKCKAGSRKIGFFNDKNDTKSIGQSDLTTILRITITLLYLFRVRFRVSAGIGVTLKSVTYHSCDYRGRCCAILSFD